MEYLSSCWTTSAEVLHDIEEKYSLRGFDDPISQSSSDLASTKNRAIVRTSICWPSRRLKVRHVI